MFNLIQEKAEYLQMMLQGRKKKKNKRRETMEEEEETTWLKKLEISFICNIVHTTTNSNFVHFHFVVEI